MEDGALGAARLVATVVLNLALALAVGAAALPAAVRRLLPGSVILMFGASAALLWFEAAAMAEVPVRDAGSALGPLLGATHYGRSWLIGLGALALVGAASLGRGRAARWAAALGLVAFACSRALMGHAAAQGDATSAVAIDAVHLLAMSLWVGEVLIAGFVTLPGPWPAAVDSPACAARVRSLSATATWALAGVVCTGGLSALRVIGSVANLTGNGYADVLLVKLTGVGMAVGLGAFNRWRVMPSLLRALSGSGDAAGPMRRFVLILRLEALILFGVVAAAAVLSLSAPPSH